MTESFSKKVKIALFLALLSVFLAASINYAQSLKQNSEKLPPGIEDKGRYQKWIDKWKDRFPQVESDHFKRVDDGEIISSTNPRYKISELNQELITAEVEKVSKDKYFVVSPDKLQILGFRMYFTKTSDPATSYISYFGKRDNKLVSGPIYECKRTKCWFDRPFYIDSDVFYVAEVQEKINTLDPAQCERDKICSYQLFLHEFNLKENNRNTYLHSELLTDFKKISEALDDL